MKLIKSQKGLGLLEVVIAIAILGAIAATYLTANSTTYRAIAIARRESISHRLAQAKMEAVKMPYDSAAGTGTQFDATPSDSYAPATDVAADTSLSAEDREYFTSNNISLTPYTIRVEAGLVSGVATMNQIQKITVTIKYNNVTIFTLVDYKVARDIS